MTPTDTGLRPRTHIEVSRHRTSEGLVRWLRCTECGRLRMLLQPDSGPDPGPDSGPAGPAVTAGSPTLGCAGCF